MWFIICYATANRLTECISKYLLNYSLNEESERVARSPGEKPLNEVSGLGEYFTGWK